MYKSLLVLLMALVLFGCGPEKIQLSNTKINEYKFLEEMYNDSYFPNHLVDKGRNILLKLCLSIEKEKPSTTEDVYILTRKATIEFNELANEFGNANSEIETAARENIARDIGFILNAYNYEFNIESAISTREW
ncbi:DUF5713 family protein [uncultured Pseudoteredinibacter sp.]|uniref:DUF5713 family protein n=1 Tax=uncultured Pseudoteredinibacter sp. TaxID=1641701 RepID=UPI00261F76A7|nr:DUF5713 family protein [uncultured Pseudoteredinibacter sp.]